MSARNFGRVIGKDFLKPSKWQDWQVGDYIQGEFVGQLETDKYGKPIMGVRVEGVQDGLIKFADMSKPSGIKNGVVPLYPNGGLLKQLAEVQEGDFVRITYEGKVKITKGQWAGTTAHSVLVEVDGYNSQLADKVSKDAIDDLLGE
jgi:hypothetical protein